MSFPYANARELFSSVLEIETEVARQTLLDEVEADQPELVERVRELLLAHAAAEGSGGR